MINILLRLKSICSFATRFFHLQEIAIAINLKSQRDSDADSESANS